MYNYVFEPWLWNAQAHHTYRPCGHKFCVHRLFHMPHTYAVYTDSICDFWKWLPYIFDLALHSRRSIYNVRAKTHINCKQSRRKRRFTWPLMWNAIQTSPKYVRKKKQKNRFDIWVIIYEYFCLFSLIHHEYNDKQQKCYSPTRFLSCKLKIWISARAIWINNYYL